MRNMLPTVLACALFLGCSDRSAAPFAPADARLSAVTTTESVVTPVTIGAFVPCANGGIGETVYLSGSLHTVSHVTLDGAGGFHMVAQTQYQGVGGVGVNTGDTYRGTGGSHNQHNGRVGEEITFVDNFGLIGQGPDNDFQSHWTLHLTVRPDGTLTTFADNFHSDCK